MTLATSCPCFLPDRVEHAVDELHRVLGAERPRQLERLVDDDRRRRRRVAQQLADRHPQNQPIENRHALGPPALGRVGDQRDRSSSSRATVSRASARGEGAQVVGRRLGVRPLQRRRTCRRRCRRRVAADVPLIEDLQRRLAGPMARVLPCTCHGYAGVACQRQLRDDRRHLDRRGRRLPPLVAAAVAGARQRLLDRVGRQHAERHRHAGRRRRRREPVRHRRRDVLEVRRLAADQTAQTDHGVEARRSRRRAARRAESRRRRARERP